MAFALLLLGVVAWNLFLPHSDPALDAIRRQGLPVTLAELNAWYAPIPPAENTALIYSEAFTLPLFNNSSSGSVAPALDNATLPTRGHHFTPENKKDLTVFLEHNQEVLRLLYSVPASGRSRYPIDLNQGFNTPLPQLAKLRTAVQLLTAEAMLHADNGEAELANKALLAAGRAAESLSDEPLLISQLVRMACWSIVEVRLERVVNLIELSEEQLASIQTMLRLAEEQPAMYRAMVGEQAIGVAFFTTPKGQATFFSNRRGPGGSAQTDRMKETLSLSLLKVLGIFQKDKSIFMQVMATNVAGAKLPFPERIQRGKQADALVSALAGRLYLFSRIMLPPLSHAFPRDGDLAARLRVAQTALAVERFRHAHNGSLPASLDGLVPTYLEAVPQDPFDGQPLRFKPLSRGYVVYSIGSDEKDDGGKERDPKNLGSSYDITFIVER
jgi:hypothetical protein